MQGSVVCGSVELFNSWGVFYNFMGNKLLIVPSYALRCTARVAPV
jgi:hypothetical protein